MTVPAHSFFAGTGVTAQLLWARDWSTSPLGPMEQWPYSLRAMVNLVLGSAFPMFVAWGPTLALLYNDPYAKLAGNKHPGALGAPFLDTWDEIRAELVPLVARALGGESFAMENLPLRMRRRGYDEDTWFTFSYSPVFGDHGAIEGLCCTCIETTASVLSEREQRADRKWWQTLFQQAPGFAAVLRGPDHVFEMANQAYLQICGDRKVLGLAVAAALPEMVEQGFIGWLDGVYQTGKPFVGRSIRVLLNRVAGAQPVEAFIDFVYQPLKTSEGDVFGIFVQGHEVTEQHRAQEALLAFSNSIPAIAWEAGAQGGLERFNSQWQAYTGLSVESALGRGWTTAVHPEDLLAAQRVWEGARKGNRAWQIEYRLRSASGEWRWFHANAVPQLDAEGRVLRWFGTTTDIQESKVAAQNLRDADRQKDEFLATLAHELRNPLAPIRTAVHLLSSPGASEAARARAAGVIGRQVGHMARLLDDLIDVARITQRRLELKKETVTAASVIEAALEAARPLADAKRHTLTTTIEDPHVQLLADPVRLAQVLSNLLNNASKYTDAGGRISLDVRSVGTDLSFTVTDSGIGLEAAAIEKVFAMFAQEHSAIDRSEGGLGIGLALVKGLVELHGGSVTATSDGAGRGSQFAVRLPYVAVASAADVTQGPGAPRPPATAPGSGRTVLLADDNRDAADVMADLLRMEGHVVHIAHDGIEAAALALRLQPDVLVLDIGMPGLNGYEVARQVRAQPWGSRPLMIAATGWGQDDDRQKAMDAGFNLHLTKPFDPAQIFDLIAAKAV